MKITTIELDLEECVSGSWRDETGTSTTALTKRLHRKPFFSKLPAVPSRDGGLRNSLLLGSQA
jgi:hypothetical protein